MLVVARYSLIKTAVFACVGELVKPLLLLHPSVFLIQFITLLNPIGIMNQVDDVLDAFVVERLVDLYFLVLCPFPLTRLDHPLLFLA